MNPWKWLSAAASLAVILSASSAYSQSLCSPDRDIPGADYRATNLTKSDPKLCAAECLGDEQCRAFAYTPAGVTGTAARCYLKNDIPVSVAKPQVCWGHRPRTKPETNYDRPGSTYSTISMTENKPELCTVNCLNDSSCLAYTFVPPGVGTAGKCYLKNTFAAKVAKVGYTSGLALKFKVEPGIARVGTIIKTLQFPLIYAEYCALACQDVAACNAFSFQLIGPEGICSLMSAVSSSSPNPLVVSGVRPK